MRSAELGNELREEVSNSASIRLDFFRHDEAHKAKPGELETARRLTAEGRKHATEIGKTKSPRPEVAAAYGSPHERAVETAMRHMLAGKEEVTPDSSLEDIRALVAGEVKVGKKDVTSENLNFVLSGEFKTIAKERLTKNKDYLVFQLEESDELVKKLKDKTSTSYSRQAAGIAELVKKYVEILPNWKRVVEKDPDKYRLNQNELRRFFGSHQTVIEPFLLKVIEKTEGREAARKFIESLPDKNGFPVSEGFEVNLSLGEKGMHIFLKLEDREWEIPTELIDQIIEDRKILDKSISES